MKKLSLFFSLFCLLKAGPGQVAPEKYFIGFTDKNNSPYSIDHPEAFLSDRALERRIEQGIDIEENDLPVNPEYAEAVDHTGVTVLNRIRWFNGLIIHTSDPSLIDTIRNFPFVKSILKNTPPECGYREFPPDKFLLENNPLTSAENQWFDGVGESPREYYGPSYIQVHQVHTDILHEKGFRGEGIMIAVLDGGFYQADVLPVFDSLRTEGRIQGTRDFVEPGNNVFTEHVHGTSVLSVMGAAVPGQLVGTAPEAMYWLLRSEDTDSEYLIEEYNWVCAAEFADSLGADIINSSLGYTTFNDPSQDHRCEDMSGNTTPVTQGANIAFTKGILVVSSAGNHGGTPWKCMSAPADGTDVMGIGAVDSTGNYAGFSSTGEATGSRVKPNVAAMGAKTMVAGGGGTYYRSNGTSFAAPVLSGSAACLMQAMPSASVTEIRHAIETSASRYLNPDLYTGYGIPDFSKAMDLLDPGDLPDQLLFVCPNPLMGNELLNIRFLSSADQELAIHIYDATGKIVSSYDHVPCMKGENTLRMDGFISEPSGFYLVTIDCGSPSGYHGNARVIKLGQ